MPGVKGLTTPQSIINGGQLRDAGFMPWHIAREGQRRSQPVNNLMRQNTFVYCLRHTRGIVHSLMTPIESAVHTVKGESNSSGMRNAAVSTGRVWSLIIWRQVGRS